jgi:2-polyprenyl-3-methyl-5-hydroxy-6-metoxy-1,4-benzoquinol methylase
MFTGSSTSSTSVYDRGVAHAGLSETQRCVLAQVPAGASVLEIGPASGYMTRVMKERGCTVDAIELNPRDAEKASAHCRKLVVGSAENADVFAELQGPYRVVLMADVLEHLRSPDETLRLVAARLTPDGEAVVSLPNIAYWKMRLDLLRGQFEYKDYGLLDRTHLRFFTRKTAEDLFHDAGFELVAAITPPPKVRRFGKLKELAKGTWPSLFALQIVYRIRRRPAQA